ncbi:MAG: polysaccharide deacetylase family protein [Candidatus Sumerlaeaceae bacterium]|nr:polysaccharide deacetylase family protein [Candidatus Sumerlaeaceae bacterium]
MMNEVQCFCIRAEDEFAPCVDYVVRTFGRWLGIPIKCTTLEAISSLSPRETPIWTIVYGAENEINDHIGIVCDRLKPVATVGIHRSSFFGPSFLVSPDLPETVESLQSATAAEGFIKYCDRLRPKVALVKLDLVAAAFWFLTRYEEYVTETPETHNRFLASFSIAPSEMYDQPVVNRWFEQIERTINELVGIKEPGLAPAKARIVLTHDVDMLRKYRGLMGVRRTIAAMMRGDAREATSEIRMASLVLAGLRRDPYDSFDDMFSLKERLGAPSTFFFMGGGDAPLDGDYSLDDQAVRELLMRVVSVGDEVALHPSYDSPRSSDKMLAEMHALEKAAGHAVIGARQHYLRFSLPETWYVQGQCGLRYDSSVGFADRAGFRCGWSGCLRPFDVEKRMELPIIELPLIAMDISLAVYEKIPAERAVERLARLLDASETRGGGFVFLWHNTLHDRRVYPGYWDTVEYFLFASAGTAEFVTAGRMCEEFELRLVTTG